MADQADRADRADRAKTSGAADGVAAEAFKAALSRWGSGVTIVTSRAGERLHGMTVSAFCSVSLDPPLVLVCADRASITLEVVEAAGCFAVNVLARGQEALSNRFASKLHEHHRFDGIPHQAGPTGAPLLDGVHAALDCGLHAAHEAGDHVILVGVVREVRLGEGEPLLYYHGRYGAFAGDGGA